MKKILQDSIPHISAIIIILVISSIYFLPQLKGYLLEQSDYINYVGMSKEIIDYRDKFDDEPLWTNSMFGGMPAYQISTKNSNILNTSKSYILKVIPRPIGYMFFLMIGFYIMLICFNIDNRIALLVSIVFGLATLNILLLATGHNTKVHAISLIPPIVGSIFYSYRKNALWGGVLLSIFLCFHLSANHLQMTYYLLFLIAAILIVELFSFIKQKKFKQYIRISFIMLFAAILGTLPTISNLIVTYEYSKSTIRGKSELTILPNKSQSQSNKSGALDRDYIKEYSFATGEIWSIAIPNIKGGASARMGDSPDFSKNISPQYQESISGRNMYWGEQRGTGGAIYFGAGIFLLFMLGAFFVKDKIKWALIIVSILSLILSIKHSFLLDVFIDYFPMFNKFRDTKMMLVIAQICFPLLGALFLNKLISTNIDKKKFLYITGSISVLFLIFYIIPDTIFDFFSKNENDYNLSQLEQYKNNSAALIQINAIIDEIKNFRIVIFKADIIRSLGFLLATGLLIYLYITGKLKKNILLLGIGVLFIIDLWFIDKQYLDNEESKGQYKHWVESYEYYNPFTATVADINILNTEMKANPALKDKIQETIRNAKFDKKINKKELQIEKEKLAFRELNFNTNYRVFSLVSPFANSRTSFFHKSIGGYHGAKLRLFQDVVEFNIGAEQQKLIEIFQDKPTAEKIDNCLRNETPVLNMLNTKYVIASTSSAPFENQYNYGDVWFVDMIRLAQSPDEEISSLSSITKDLAIVSIKNQNKVKISANRDLNGIIELSSYKPNHLIYNSQSQTNQYAVFSEIYYKDGWNAYLDGEKTEYFKTNYLLRGMNIPSGTHKIEFKFEPGSYYLGRNISNIGSVLVLLFIGFAVFMEFRRRKIL